MLTWICTKVHFTTIGVTLIPHSLTSPPPYGAANFTKNQPQNVKWQSLRSNGMCSPWLVGDKNGVTVWLRIVHPVLMRIIAEKLQCFTLKLVSKLEIGSKTFIKANHLFFIFLPLPNNSFCRASKYTKMVNSWTVYDGHFVQTAFGWSLHERHWILSS